MRTILFLWMAAMVGAEPPRELKAAPRALAAALPSAVPRASGDPAGPAAAAQYMQMGKDEFQAGRHGQALDHFLSVLRHAPDNVEAKTYIIRIGEFWREALAKASWSSKDLTQAHAEVYRLVEKRRSRLGELDRELEEVRRQLESGAVNSRGLLKASRSLAQLKEFELGDQVLRQQSLRYIQLLQQQLRGAMQKGGVFQNPKDILVARGYLWYYKNDLDRALAEWKKALALSPEDSALREQIEWVTRKKTLLDREKTVQELAFRAENLSIDGKFDEALLYWRSLVALAPENKDFQKRLVEAQDKVRATKSERTLRSGRSALRQGDLVRASQAFLEVLEIDPASREALDQLKVIQQRLMVGSARPPTAGAAAAKGRAEPASAPPPVRSRKSSEEQYTLGLIYYAQGEMARAREALESALRHDPSNQKAKTALGRLQAELLP